MLQRCGNMARSHCGIAPGEKERALWRHCCHSATGKQIFINGGLRRSWQLCCIDLAAFPLTSESIGERLTACAVCLNDGTPFNVSPTQAHNLATTPGGPKVRQEKCPVP